MHGEGFEPSHPKIVGLKSTALDHSAIRALNSFTTYSGRFKIRVMPPNLPHNTVVVVLLLITTLLPPFPLPGIEPGPQP